MKKRIIVLSVLAGALLVQPLALFAGGGNGNGAGQVKNDHDGNGQGTGRGSGNVPVPADRNNDHGMINRGGNYNNGRKAQVPFDGGLSLLLVAGVGIGAKRAYDKRKKEPADQKA